jgi:hypothetical protein
LRFYTLGFYAGRHYTSACAATAAAAAITTTAAVAAFTAYIAFT